MNAPVSPYESNPPSAKSIATSVGIAALAAALVLVTIVLPAEYNIDPTRIGHALGLTAINAPARTIKISEVVGGNEKFKEIAIPDAGQPMPLPNPAVFQKKEAPAQTQSMTITLQPGEETEIKSMLNTAQVMLFHWQVEGGQIYADFHGHEPGASNAAWVRYEEQVSGSQGSGSLVAPFDGEHGWYWLNISDTPVTIELTVTGYFEKLIDYGLKKQ